MSNDPNNLERELRDLGSRIWPEPGVVGDEVTTQRWRRRRALLFMPRGAAPLIAVLATVSLMGSALAAVLVVRDRGGSGGGAAVVGAASSSAEATAPPGETTAPGTAPGVVTPEGSGSAAAVTANPATPGSVPPATPLPRTPTPTSTPPPAGTLTLTEADAGRSVTVHRGDTIVVQLHAMSSYVWTVPQTSNATVVAQRSGAQSSNGDATGTFAAVAGGTADLSATENPRCYPQCLPPSKYWSVHITVIS